MVANHGRLVNVSHTASYNLVVNHGRFANVPHTASYNVVANHRQLVNVSHTFKNQITSCIRYAVLQNIAKMYLHSVSILNVEKKAKIQRQLIINNRKRHSSFFKTKL